MSNNLAILKMGYSRSPWRICWHGEEIQHLCFERKRDAVPFLVDVSAIVGESYWRDLTTEQREAIGSVIARSPGFKSWAAVVTRQATSPFL
jgi:hypothetical protein